MHIWKHLCSTLWYYSKNTSLLRNSAQRTAHTHQNVLYSDDFTCSNIVSCCWIIPWQLSAVSLLKRKRFHVNDIAIVVTTASRNKIKKTIKKITVNWRTMNLEEQEGKQQKISDVAEPKMISPQMILVLLLTINREWKGEDKKKKDFKC